MQGLPGPGVAVPLAMGGQQQLGQPPYAASVRNPNIAVLHPANTPTQLQNPCGDSVTPSARQSAARVPGFGEASGTAADDSQGNDDSPPTDIGAADATPIAAALAGVFNSSSNSGSSDKPNSDSSPSTD